MQQQQDYERTFPPNSSAAHIKAVCRTSREQEEAWSRGEMNHLTAAEIDWIIAPSPEGRAARYQTAYGDFWLETTELDIRAEAVAKRIGLRAGRCACRPNLENHGGYRLSGPGDVAVNDSHHYTMTTQQVIDYCSTTEGRALGQFEALIGLTEDPLSVRENLRHAADEGVDVVQLVRAVWDEVGISDPETMRRAVVQYYSPHS
jgi:hypothetical protein